MKPVKNLTNLNIKNIKPIIILTILNKKNNLILVILLIIIIITKQKIDINLWKDKD